jgi:hypothetical protein
MTGEPRLAKPSPLSLEGAIEPGPLTPSEAQPDGRNRLTGIRQNPSNRLETGPDCRSSSDHEVHISGQTPNPGDTGITGKYGPDQGERSNNPTLAGSEPRLVDPG